MVTFFCILGALCLVYFVGLILYLGSNSSFVWTWLILSLCFFLAGLGIRLFKRKEIALSVWLHVFLITTAAIFCILFVFVEGSIISHMQGQPEKEYDYVIILGAQVKGDIPSKVLRQRLDAAISYLQEHENTLVIVSGGQGEGEAIPEALAMYRYLVANGISNRRIVREERSYNTAQNILYSKRIINHDDALIGIVSSDYHLYRAVAIARKLGLSNVSGLSASTDMGVLPNYLLREFFSVVKDFFTGKL